MKGFASSSFIKKEGTRSRVSHWFPTTCLLSLAHSAGPDVLEGGSQRERDGF